MTNEPKTSHELYDAVIDCIRDNANSLSEKDLRKIMCEIDEIMNDTGTRQYEVAHIPTCTMKKISFDNGYCTWGCVCSNCDSKFEHETGKSWDYCPNCGAIITRHIGR